MPREYARGSEQTLSKLTSKHTHTQTIIHRRDERTCANTQRTHTLHMYNNETLFCLYYRIFYKIHAQQSHQSHRDSRADTVSF